MRKITYFKPHPKLAVASLATIALGATMLLAGTSTSYADQADGTWSARTVEQIKADTSKSLADGVYTIHWGDTLSGISEATGITIEDLAYINSISNIDFIYAGNSLYFNANGNLVVVQSNGATIEASVSATSASNFQYNVNVAQSQQSQAQTPVQSQSTSNAGTSTGSNTVNDHDNGGDTGASDNSSNTDWNTNSNNSGNTDGTSDNGGETVTPTPQNTWRVWYTGRETSNYNITPGELTFTTEDEATNFIDGYADALLTGITYDKATLIYAVKSGTVEYNYSVAPVTSSSYGVEEIASH